MKAVDEKWRMVLAWGCVVIFLLAPVLIFGLHMIGLLQGIDKDLDYLSRWYFAVTGVLISLAGLNTLQFVKGNGNHKNGNDCTTTTSTSERTLRTTEAKLDR
jgi:hypothetical protein